MKTNRSSVRDRCNKAISGIKQHLASEPSVPLAGASFTPTELEARLQGAVDSADATVAARGNFRDAVKAEHALRASILALLSALKAFVVLKFGANAAQVLADFGFVPRKQTTRSTDQKSMAVARGRATRKARHTMGPVQKRDVKGTVSNVTITDPHSAAAAPVAPSQAPTTPTVTAPAAPAGSTAGPSTAAPAGPPAAGAPTPHTPTAS
jgi:hypothetical protein